MRFTTIITICLSLGLFTGCGGSDSKSDATPVTTIPACPASPYFVSGSTNTWQISQTDTRICTPTPGTLGNGQCKYNEVKVRVPKTLTNNRPVYTYYHEYAALYDVKCVAQGSAFILSNPTGKYLYMDAGSAQFAWNSQYSVSYSAGASFNLRPGDALLALFVIGAIALSN